MRQACWRRVIVKTVLTIVIVAVSVPVFVISAVGLMLHSGMAGELLHDAIDRYVKADVSYTSIKGSVLHLPKLTVEVDDLLVSFPTERFDSLYANGSSFAREGMGETSDTLLYVHRLDAGLNILELLKGTVCVSYAEADGIRAYLHRFGPEKANWNIFPPAKNKKDKKRASIPTVMLKHVNMGGNGSRVVFCTHKDPFSAALDLEMCRVERNGHFMDLSLALDAYAQKGGMEVISAPLVLETSLAARNKFGTFNIFIPELQADIFGIPFEARGKLGIRPGVSTMEMNASIPNCPIGDLMGKYSSFIPEAVQKVSTDARLSVFVESDGTLSPQHDIYPKTVFSVTIPSSRLSYQGVVENGTLDLDLDGVMSASKVLDINLKDICLQGNGVDLKASAEASDLLGKGLKFSADVDSKIELEPLLAFIMGTNKIFDAVGNLDLNLTARDVTRSHLRIPGFTEADIKAEISGDVLDVTVPGQDLLVHVDHPQVEIRNMESLVQDGKRALGAMVKLDSVDARFNGQFIRGRKLKVMAQNTVGDIHDSTQVPPVRARVVADMLAFRESDSLSLVTLGTDNQLTIKPVSIDGRDVPDISLESRFDKFAYLSASDRVALIDVSLGASARKKASRDLTRSSRLLRKSARPAVDSTFVPEFLKEKDFMTADINFSLARSMQKIFRDWNPSCRLSVGSGLLFFGSYPVNNRVRNLEFAITPSYVEIGKATVLSGNSDISLSSRLTGIRKIMTGRGRGMLDLDVDIKSKRMDLNEILTALQASKTTGKATTSSRVENMEQLQKVFADTLSMVALKDSASRGYPLLVVPSNLNVSIAVRGDSLKYAGFNFDDLSADVNMKERCIQLTDLKASSDMGSVSMDAFYSTINKDSINVGYNLSLEDVTAGRVIELIPEVGEAVPFLNSFKGIIDFGLTVTSKVDTNMNFIIPSISGVAEINGQNLVIEDLTSLKKIANLLKFKDREVGHIDDMNIKALIGDNQIEVFPFMLGFDRYQLALTGSQGFSHDYEYHVSVIKSPLPFKLGLKIYGDSYKSVKFHFEKPQYTSTVLPLYDPQIDRLQHNLISSIRDIFERGVQAAVEETRMERQSLTRRKEEDDSCDESVLSAEEFEKYDMEMIKSQIEEDDILLSREIDEIMKSF